MGTSLPELVASIVSIKKGKHELIIGTVLGSNIFNILSILGITSMVTEVPVNEVIISNDVLWMLGITLLLLPIMLIKRQIGPFDGVILLGVYVFYTYRVIFV